jgi:hypothetical protein
MFFFARGLRDGICGSQVGIDIGIGIDMFVVDIRDIVQPKKRGVNRGTNQLSSLLCTFQVAYSQGFL